MGTGRAVQHHLLLSLAKVVALLGIAAVFLFAVLPKLHADYGAPSILDSRTVVWLVMQLHLMFAAFVLRVLC